MRFHSTSSNLSRRQFLKVLLAMGGLSTLSFFLEKGMARTQNTWQEPMWVLSLRNDALCSPIGQAVPKGMPGSIMKLVAATALLEEKLLTPEVELECRGTLHIAGQTFNCQQAHGCLGIQKAIAVSCNLFFVQAAELLSPRRFLAYAKLFQLDQPMPGGQTFLFPEAAQGGQPSQLYVLGLSKDMQPNALQLLRLAGIVAQRRIPEVQASTWQILQNGMRQSVLHGTAALLDSKNQWRIAAKTGTTRHGYTFQSWLIGYFPFDKPRYAFCVRSPVGTAGEAAVPIARRVLSGREWL